MRVTVGTIAVLGLAVTVAVAQPPVPRERAATLKAPQALAPGELPPVARGAVDDFPPSPSLSSTPVMRPNGARAPGVSNGPAWLGSDTNVRPAAGIGSNVSVRPLTPPPAAPGTDDPRVQPRLLDRIKGTPAGEKQPPPKQLPQPVQPVQPKIATAASPFRGTGANGAPVYAGPPAYRWYGWGSVTPGANPLAPTGQYPKASANWYSITGATPGAFPVPVSHPSRIPQGTEPPTYGLAARTPVPQPAAPVATLPPPGFQYTDRPEPPRPELPRFAPPPEPKLVPAPGVGVAPPTNLPAAPVGVPVLAPPPLPTPVVIAPPVLPAPPALPVPKPEAVAALPPLPPVLPPVPSVAPVPSAEPVKVPAPVLVTESKPVNVVPSPLPTSVTTNVPPVATNPPREELRWQQSSEPAAPAPGTWAPAPGATPLPTMSPEALPAGRTGSAPVTPVVARGQMGDKTPDPVGTLVKQVCQGRASDVEVRWIGTKKLSVCFEVRTAPEAQKLVNDISRRPELTAYQIDFCVLVK